MNLNSDGWYVRYFFWSVSVWSAFIDQPYLVEKIKERGTNLCFFIRVMVVWAPLVMAIHGLLFAAALGCVLILPVYFFGGEGYSWFVGIAVGLVVVVGFIVRPLLKLLSRKQSEWVERHREKLKNRPERVKIVKIGPTFFEVLWAFIVATKHKICPTVSFLDGDEVTHE